MSSPLPGLQYHRTRAGLSRRNLAQRAGLATMTVYRMEMGQHSPSWGASLHTAQVLAEALEVSVEDLLQEPRHTGPTLTATHREMMQELAAYRAPRGKVA